MREFILRLPQELEDKIREYVFYNTDKILLLLEKYPLSFDLFNGLTKNQVNRVYKSACIAKFLSWSNGGYYGNMFKEHIRCLFPMYYHDNHLVDRRHLCAANHPSVYMFAERIQPPFHFNKDWSCGGKRFEPSRLECMQSIVQFCYHIIDFPRRYKNKWLQEYCDKIVYQMIICVLIVKRNNESRV
jgi:hypothetical protein